MPGHAGPYRVAVARVSTPRAVPGHRGDHALAEEVLTRLAGSVRCPAVIRGPELVMLLPEQPLNTTPEGDTGTKVVSASHVLPLILPQTAGHQITCGLSEPAFAADRRHASAVAIR